MAASILSSSKVGKPKTPSSSNPARQVDLKRSAAIQQHLEEIVEKRIWNFHLPSPKPSPRRRPLVSSVERRWREEKRKDAAAQMPPPPTPEKQLADLRLAAELHEFSRRQVEADKRAAALANAAQEKNSETSLDAGNEEYITDVYVKEPDHDDRTEENQEAVDFARSETALRSAVITVSPADLRYDGVGDDADEYEYFSHGRRNGGDGLGSASDDDAGDAFDDDDENGELLSFLLSVHLPIAIRFLVP